MHRDTHGRKVARNLLPSSRRPGEAPPLSVLSSFDEPTVLRVVYGSHRCGGKDAFPASSIVAHGIPTGNGSMWYGHTVHGGAGAPVKDIVRGHMYMTATGSSLPQGELIDPVAEIA